MTDGEEDFATMFEASLKAKRFKRGQTIEGAIVAIGPEVALVNVGGKGEAQIEASELKDDDGALEVAVGDRIQATVVSTEGGLVLSRKLARGAATNRQIEDAFRAGLPVEGKVEGEIKGGYEVRIAGQRAFCPFSQIDTVRATDPAQHIGRVYSFRIIEYKDSGKNLVVSRRALLEEEQRANAVEVRRSIAVGDVLTGRVTSVVAFGAFVDLGAGVQGLLHVSEMAWTRVANPAEIVSPGQDITVKVLRVDEDRQKISLGLKQLSPDPRTTAEPAGKVAQRDEDLREYEERTTAESAEGFGSLADKLKGALVLRGMSKEQHQHTADEERINREAALDRTIESSFPASDPPSTDPNPNDHDAVVRETPAERRRP